MKDINGLADKWKDRADHSLPSDVGAEAHCCAIELEAALPTWTEITDDPDTWPVTKMEYILAMNREMISPVIGIASMSVDKDTREFYIWDGERFDITHWRPLCSLDCPPEEVS